VSTAQLSRHPAGDPNVAADWEQAHRYTPAPRHRRRLLFDMVRGLDGVRTVLDAGCAQPFLLERLVRELGLEGAGADLSDEVMAESRKALPECDFLALDLAAGRWPGDRTFDLVICSETLEHIEDWEKALDNVLAMARGWALITVPSGPVRPVDRLMGHHRHFRGEDITSHLSKRGWEAVTVRQWGFPVHSLYRWAVHHLGSDRVYDSFAEGRPYSRTQIAASEVLYRLFFVNDLFRRGSQLIVLGRPAR
jgi:hypothetical protein